ncbi:hypothetical protein BGX26_004046, partial [Mortierella sp. AD094]
LKASRSRVACLNRKKISHRSYERSLIRTFTPPVAKYDLPEIGERITSTPQLAYCLSLLNPSMVPKEQVEYNWSQARVNDPDEQERLQAMATNLIRTFFREEPKKSNVVAEIVSLPRILLRSLSATASDTGTLMSSPPSRGTM